MIRNFFTVFLVFIYLKVRYDSDLNSIFLLRNDNVHQYKILLIASFAS